jgi:hypothetical protein
VKNPRLLLAAGLALFLLGFAWYALGNVVCRPVSDPSTYLDFGENLARGRFSIDYPPDRVFQEYFPPGAIIRGSHDNLWAGGRTFSFADIGYPLYLALFFRLGGRYAPFFANAVAFAGIFVLLAALCWSILPGHPRRLQAALLAPVLYFLLNREHIRYLLACYNDPLSYLLLLLSMLLLVRHLAGRRDRDILLAGLCLGLAVTVRKTSFVAALPLLVLWARDAVARRGPVGWRTLVFAGLATVAGMGPILAQNWANTGNPLYSTHVLAGRVWRGEIATLDEEKPATLTGIGLAHVPHSFDRQLRNVLEPLGWGLGGVLLAGVWFGRSAPAVPWLLLPFAAVFLGFHSLVKITPWRYVFIVQMVLAPLLALGVAEGAARLGERLRARFLPGAAAAALLAFALVTLLTPPRAERFQVRQAEAFRKDVERVLPAGALVIAERPMRRIIDFFTHAYGLKPEDFVRPAAGLTLRAGLQYYRRTLNGVYFFDAADGFRTGYAAEDYDHTRATREQLLSWYDLTPVATFTAADYDLGVEFGKAQATLYRLDDWAAHEVTATVPRDTPGEAILRISSRDHGSTGATLPAEVRWGDRVIASSLADGISWHLLPADPGAGAAGTLRVSSPAALPRDLAPAVFGLDAPLDLGPGPEAVPRAAAFLSPAFAQVPRAGRSFLTGTGRAWLPCFPAPGSTVVFTTAVRLSQEGAVAGRLRLVGGGSAAEFDLHGSGLSTVSLPLERPDPGRNTAEVTYSFVPTAGQAVPDRQPWLRVQACRVSRLREAGLPLTVAIGRDDEAFLASGFYHAEQGPGGTRFRWTDGAARLRIAASAAAAGSALRVTLRASGPPPAAPGRRVRLALNGTPLGEASLASDAVQALEFPVPRGLLRPGLNDLLIASDPWEPRALLQLADDRRLGIRVESLRIDAGAGSPAGGAGPAPLPPRPEGGT